MTIYIDQGTQKRVNIHAPYAGFSRLDTPEIRARAGVVETADPIPPADFDFDRYEAQEIEDAPYIDYKRRSDAEIQRRLDTYALQDAKKHLLDTDYLFTVDKYAQLTEERKVEMTAAREASRVVIREYAVKYPPLTDEAPVDVPADTPVEQP